MPARQICVSLEIQVYNQGSYFVSELQILGAGEAMGTDQTRPTASEALLAALADATRWVVSKDAMQLEVILLPGGE